METIGRYVLHGVIASGGTASVHFARVVGALGFRRIVAVKRLHAELAKDPSFRAMLLEEARIAARIRHANVVSVVDVVDDDSNLCLVMEYVAGETLSRLRRAAHEKGAPIPPPVVAAIVVDLLRGLHAAHELTGADGEPMQLVHRDVSPQNVIVGVDGVARIVDFGIAKAVGSAQNTRTGEVKGKAAYMAPEQLRGELVDRRSDVFAAGIVLWELLCSRRLFAGDSPAASMMRVLERDPEVPSTIAPGIPRAVDAVVLRALDRDPARRFDTAEAMADALRDASSPAAPREVATWLDEIAGDGLRARAAEVTAIEADEGMAPAPVQDVPRALASGPDAPKRRIPIVGIAVAAVAAAALVIVIATGVARRSATAASSAPSAAASSSAPASEPLDDAPATTETTPLSSVGGGSTRPPARVRPPRLPPPARSAKTDRCNPPYVVDARGIHVMKAECL